MSVVSTASGTPNFQDSDCLESRAITIEWKITNLKTLFDSSKGDTKSKCIKSPFFGEGKWQIFFYPNSGAEQYCSLYLSCEPTLEEREAGRALAAASLAAASASGKPLPAPKKDTTRSRESSSTAGAGGGSGTGGSGGSGGNNWTPENCMWKREGLYKFVFEIKSVPTEDHAQSVLMKEMSAPDYDHAFDYERRNWGWAQYCKRSDIFYNNARGRAADAFMIICSIWTLPVPPKLPTPSPPRRLIPVELVEAFASLFNDPAYSDVVFEIRWKGKKRVGGKGDKQDGGVRRLYASRKVLCGRSDYFDTMFNSGFSEADVASTLSDDLFTDSAPRAGHKKRNYSISTTTSTTGPYLSSPSSGDEGEGDDTDEEMDGDEDDLEFEEEGDEYFEDDEGEDEGGADDEGQSDEGGGGADVKDDEGDADDSGLTTAEEGETDIVGSVPASTHRRKRIRTGHPKLKAPFPSQHDIPANSDAPPLPSPLDLPMRKQSGVSAHSSPLTEAFAGEKSEDAAAAEQTDLGSSAEEGGRDNISSLASQASTSATSVTRKDLTSKQVQPRAKDQKSRGAGHGGGKDRQKNAINRPRAKVVVTDATYNTFRALLFYLYTDSIAFAPLLSTFQCTRDASLASGLPFPYPTRRHFAEANKPKRGDSGVVMGIDGRILGPHPCDAKGIYILADKLHLPELKARSFEHITQSLTVENIPYEVCGSFSARFEEIRKVEIAFLLEKWNEVRNAEAMKKVIGMIRVGKFPGFEEVLFHVLGALEYRPAPTPKSVTRTEVE